MSEANDEIIQDAVETATPAVQDDPKSAPLDRSTLGPYDLTEVPAIRPYVDLGAIKILPREGLKLRIDVEEGTQRLVAVSLDFADSTLQLQAFSAPKGSGVWLGILQQITAQLSSQGATLVAEDGPFGPEATASVEGSTGPSMRFIGVDGPRWVLRGIVSGAALTDEEKRGEIESLFRSIVVVRGDMPMPPRELLPLRVPAGTRPQE
jgi:hypothetical protein